MGRIGKAFKAFFAVLNRGEDAVKIREEIKVIPEKTLGSEKRADCVDLLTQFQEKARFIDFLLEDIDGYDDSQVGSAVRNIHKDCREMIFEYFKLESVVPENDENEYLVEEGFDPYVIKLVGNVSGTPPFKGEIQHPGWKVTEVKLPARSEDADPDIVSPAEIEI